MISLHCDQLILGMLKILLCIIMDCDLYGIQIILKHRQLLQLRLLTDDQNVHMLLNVLTIIFHDVEMDILMYRDNNQPMVHLPNHIRYQMEVLLSNVIQVLLQLGLMMFCQDEFQRQLLIIVVLLVLLWGIQRSHHILLLINSRNFLQEQYFLGWD